MSSAYDRGPQRASHHEETQDSRPASEPAGSQMLDQVLASMSGRVPAAGFVEPGDVKVLSDVARNFAGQPFSLEPVAVELVHAMLQVQFQKAGLPSATVRAMAGQIAATLCDDPPSRERLEALWKGLTHS